MSLSPIHQERWKSHAFGTCLVRHSDQLVYINIPKNATDWTKRFFGGQRHNYYKDPLPENYQYIVVLREPIERWYSGFAEWVKRYSTMNPNSEIFQNANALQLLVNSGALDEHTELQARFITDIPLQKITFFKCDETYNETIKDWFEKNNFSVAKFNQNKSHETQGPFKDLKSKIQEIIEQRDKLKSSVLDYIKRDNELYNSVQYYIKGNE